MKILHTSDWHLGRLLYGRKRYEEFETFLKWLEDTIQSEEIECLLIAGDVFDTNTPGNRAQELYYRFLAKVSKKICRHIVVIAGNHDSPSLLDAPKSILSALNVYVVGTASENPTHEVIILKDKQGIPEAIICAVPYLRDRDIRKVEFGESLSDKDQKLKLGIQQHYEQVCNAAKQLKDEYQETYPGRYVPIIGMGHLFAAGGKTLDGDGVRELYVGSLAHVHAQIFPDYLDYVALGHLHVPQVVNQLNHIRYCGSPIPMGFGEAKQQKLVLVISFDNTQIDINETAVPCFQSLVKLSGDLEKITTELNELILQNSNAWLEIEYTGKDIIGNLPEQVNTIIENSDIEIRRIKNKRVFDRVINKAHETETLEDLSELEVFERCLSTHDIQENDRQELLDCYHQILNELNQADPLAE